MTVFESKENKKRKMFEARTVIYSLLYKLMKGVIAHVRMIFWMRLVIK